MCVFGANPPESNACDPCHPFRSQPAKTPGTEVFFPIEGAFSPSRAGAANRPGAREDEQGQKWPTYINQRRTHTISPALRPAADAFARAIEAQYGYERVGPDILNIQLLNTAMWEEQWYTGTLGKALFSQYRY